MILSVPEVLAPCGGHQEQLKNVIVRACYFSDQYEGCFTTKQRKTLTVEDLGVIVRFRFAC